MLNFKQKKLGKKIKERLEQEKVEKELQAKINIKKTLSNMKSQSNKLEGFKQEYINKARKAKLVGDEQAYKLAKSGIKICLSKQKAIDSMVANFEISMQLNDMNKVISNFIEGINILSEQMKNVTTNIDIVKAQRAYEQAMENNEGQYQSLDLFLETSSETISSIDGTDSNISDDEIEQLISVSATELEGNMEKEIDDKINEIHAKLQC